MGATQSVDAAATPNNRSLQVLPNMTNKQELPLAVKNFIDACAKLPTANVAHNLFNKGEITQLTGMSTVDYKFTTLQTKYPAMVIRTSLDINVMWQFEVSEGKLINFTYNPGKKELLIVCAHWNDDIPWDLSTILQQEWTQTQQSNTLGRKSLKQFVRK
jgi:hypothetical protein